MPTAMQQISRYQCNVRWRSHHTSACHVRHTNLQEPSRANFTYPSPIRRRTFANHDDVHAGTLQTANRCSDSRHNSMQARFSSRRLRHRLHTQDGLTQKPCHSMHQESTINIEASSCTFKPTCNSHLKIQATTIIANNSNESRQPTKYFHNHAIR